MRGSTVFVSLLGMMALVHCMGGEPDAAEEVSAQSAALCFAEWNPTWQQAAEANEWWLEFNIGGGTVASAYLEVPGRANVTLARDAWGKWVGLANAAIPRGTLVVLHAQNDAGKRAQSVRFAYLNVTTPANDPCPVADAGTDARADGGACDAWSPTIDQASANAWWIEYTIGGSVRAASLQIVGGTSIDLTSQWGKWAAPYGAGIPSGTSVVLRVESTTGQKAETLPFRYLVDARPALKPCAPPPACSGYSPTWRLESGANNWWIEYAVSNAKSVRLELAGGTTINLTNQWGKWSAPYAPGIPTGTSVVLKAESTTNQPAETVPFRYLVDNAPSTKPCATDVGLDTRPANPTCVAPARPGAASTAGLSAVYGDIFTAAPGLRVTSPMLMAQRPGNGSRWFLAQRDGRIVSFNATEPAATRDLRQVLSSAQLSALTGKTVNQADEGGFHGMAFDPSFSTNGRLYVSFATTCDGNVPICDDPKNLNGDYYKYASEIGYLTSPDGGATFTSYTRLLHIGRWAQMHYGGSLAFGPDGLLYISSGDGLDDSDVQFNDNFFGKVLRIDVKGPPAPGKAYGIPPTNPFAGGGGRPEIFAWGLRNPFRMSVDRLTGDVWLGDVGQDSYEEVNRIQRGGNYGWPCREGAHPGPSWNVPSKCPNRVGLIDPIVEHAHVGIGRSVTGGVVYRGGAINGFQGTYVYGDFIQKELRSLSLEGGVWTSRILNGAGPQDGYVSFNEDSAGEVYAVSLFDQKIHKLVPSGPGGPVQFPQLLSQTGCVLPSDPKTPAAGVLPYDVNSPLWSDGADKERWLAIPDGTRVTVRADGDFDFPIGSVLLKTFSIAGRRVETRLFVRHADGEWGGYSYEWNEAQTDATLLPSGKVKMVAGQEWSFPSRSECGLCHTAAAGRSLGLEIGQLNGSMRYAATGRNANQLKTLSHIGLFESPLADPATLVAYPKPFEGAPSEAKARSYLHANCSSCHQPNGGAARSTLDMRFATPLAATNACNAVPILDNFGIPGARLIKPGAPTESVLSLRMHALDARKMPPLGKSIKDVRGTGLVDAWITGLAGCP